MKVSEMNARQRKAFFNIKNAANWHIGGLENTMLDNEEGSSEYESAKRQLENHNELVAIIYDLAITEVYGDGYCCFGSDAEKFLKDIRFCGKEWLMERVEKRVTKCGY